MKKLIVFVFFVFAFACVFAQEEPDDIAYGVSGESGLRFGGWFTPVMFYSGNGDDSLFMSANTLKLFAAYSSDKIDFYVRGRDTFSRVISEKNYDGDMTKNVADLDAGYVKIKSRGKKFSLSAGRKFFVLGNGIVLNGRGDGGEALYETGAIGIKAFGMYTGLLHKDLNPYRLSSKDFSDGSQRIFAGVSVFKDIYNNHLFAYALLQNDRSRNVDLLYKSRYFSAGAKGIVSDSFLYKIEAIAETGKSCDSVTGGENDILAKSGYASFDYLADAAVTPVVGLSYFYASGDSDRQSYIDGSANRGSDGGFIAFGNLPLGMALNPAMGNLHDISASFSLRPFASGESFRHLSLSLRYDYYMKDKKSSVITSSDEANISQRNVGQAFEFVLRNAPYSDFSFYALYSIFIPGKAYPSSAGKTSFVMGGLNLIF